MTTLSGCLGSWEATGNTDDLATAIKYWNVLLDDYQIVGDGAGGDAVVTHDTGYAMRTFAPYSALAYDWLHDAPGVTEALRAHARERFNAWVSYYAAGGYLKDMPDSNYEAGFAFATTLIAIAEGGEAGATGDGHWALARDTIWGTDLAAGLKASGVLNGGDWAEGWEYGPLSVMELSMAARAMGENGAPVAGIQPWADSLLLRFAHGLTPVSGQVFAGGDTQSTTTNIPPMNGTLLATIAGPASAQAKSWARQLNANLAVVNDNPLFDALAAASTGASAVIPVTSPTSYLATGTGNWYVRGAWTKSTAWSVFECSHRLVADHQHNDAGNWVLTRGADDLVVDPSPYGSLSSLTSNAPAVDSAILPSGYSPSQADWGQTTHLDWAKQSSSGIGVARCDYADQFRSEDVASDVAHAIRDFVLVPNGDSGTVVVVDRAVTGDPARGLHLRVRTPSTLALDGNTATATVGASSVIIQNVWSTSGTPNVRDMPLSPDCSSSSPGTCDISRLPSGQEYRVDVAGPNAAAIHVVDAVAAGASPPSNVLLSGNGYRGVLLGQGATPVAVITNGGPDGTPGSSLVYRVPAGTGTAQVVVDAPIDANGRSDVSGALDGTDCVITVVPHGQANTSFDGLGLVIRVTSRCAISEDAAVVPIDAGDAGANPGAGGASAGGVSAGSGGKQSAGGAGAVLGAGGTPSASVGGNVGATNGGSTSNGGSSASAQSGAGDANTPSDGGITSPAGAAPSCSLGRGRSESPLVPPAMGTLALFFLVRRYRRAHA